MVNTSSASPRSVTGSPVIMAAIVLDRILDQVTGHRKTDMEKSLASSEECDSGKDSSTISDSRLEEDSVPFEDGFRGKGEGALAGGFVLRKRDGTPSYQLAVVVDDAADGITEVLRADDLIPSTPRQLLLYRLFGWDPPSFIHVPLITGPDGLRLAKRHGDTSLGHYRRQGISAAEVVGTLAHLCGLAAEGERWMPEDLIEQFALEKLSPNPTIWDGIRQSPGRH